MNNCRLLKLWKPIAAQCIALVLAVAVAAPVQAGWLTKIIREAGERSGGAARRGTLLAAGSLDKVAAHIKSLPLKVRAGALGVDITQEGHFRFVNARGEKFTAGTRAELKRAVALILPGGAVPGAKLTLYLTVDSVFLRRALLADLPVAAEIRVVWNKRSYRLLRQGKKGQVRLYARLNLRVVVELTEPDAFREAVWQLRRPLQRADIRVLSLEPGGPQHLPYAPRIDKASGRAMADRVDPYALTRSMASIRGQTALAVGRFEGEFLYFKPAGASEGAVRLSELRKAARNADVNLIVLNVGSSRQPGVRNWLWQRAQVEGLEDALTRASVLDFMGALGGRAGTLEVTLSQQSLGRVHLTAAALKNDALLPTTDGLSNMVSDAVAALAGNLVLEGFEASLRSRDRQSELDRRIIIGVASWIQYAYLALVLLGFIASSVGRSWWRRVWPLERRAEYRSRFGFRAAQGVRSLVFVLIFMPLSAPPALPVYVATRIWRWVTIPVRAWRWLRRRRNA